MRRRLLATLIASLFLATAPPSQAQRDAIPATGAPREVLRPSSPRSVSFRMRSADERLASVRRLEAEARRRAPRALATPMPLTPTSFADTFSVTARSPHVPGQGSLYATHAILDSRPEPSGEVILMHTPTPELTGTHGRFAIELHIPDTRRLLVECTVVGNNEPIRGYLYWYGGQELWSDHSTAYQNVISFLTPPIPESAGSLMYFGVWPTNPNPSLPYGMYGGWALLGCQVTRLSLP